MKNVWFRGVDALKFCSPENSKFNETCDRLPHKFLRSSESAGLSLSKARDFRNWLR